MYEMVLRDALHVASDRVVRGNDDRLYARGMIVGAVAGVMSTGVSFNVALKRIMADMPKDLASDTMPVGW